MERLRAAIEQARKARDDGATTGDAETSADTAIQTNGDAVQPAPAPTKAKNGNGVVSGDTDLPHATPNRRGGPEVAARWDNLREIDIKPARLRRNRLVGPTAKGPERAAMDMLRTRLLALTQKEDWRRVAITSPTMACGKSTTTLNLALAMSRLPDLRTLVLETDMRRPSMAKMLGIKGKQSVFDVMNGRADFADQAVRIAENVAVSVNFGVVRDPAEILHRQRTAAVLDLIEEAYQPDIVLFDMPPMLQSDDTLGFIKNVDCAVLVALAETTTLDQVDFCETELAAHTQVAGVVLNRCRYVGGGYGYGYGEY